MTDFKCMHKPSTRHQIAYDMRIISKSIEEIAKTLEVSESRVRQMINIYIDWLSYEKLKANSPIDNMMHLDLCDGCMLSMRTVSDIARYSNYSILELSKHKPEALLKIRFLSSDKAIKVIDVAKSYVNNHSDYYNSNKN